MDFKLLRTLQAIAGKRGCYTGDPLETGGTSINSPVGASMAALAALLPPIDACGGVLDYGAGKYGRSSVYLRGLGYKVYAYDPFNGGSGGGWEGGVSNVLPKDSFDVVFTSFVLNVVPCHIEDGILQKCNSVSSKQIHLTRNTDIYDTVKKNLLSGKSNLISDFFLAEFASKEEKDLFKAGVLDDATIMEFCYFGVQTSRGFQRIPVLEEKGYTLKKKTSGWKLYAK